MDFPPQFPIWEAGLIGAWSVIGIGVYLALVRLVRRGGGKVSAAEYGQPDLLACVVLIGWFGLVIANGFGVKPAHAVTEREIVDGALLFLAMIAGIWGFLMYRHIEPARQFGLGRRGPLIAAAMATGLILAALPLLFATQWATHLALGNQADSQRIVNFFNEAAHDSNQRAVYLTMILGVIVAPAAEETIFRGYIYGVLKRYVGPLAASLISAGVFAALHLSLSSLPALFVLALCLTLAYEASGSLLVNILMHALFNLFNFMVMLSQSAK